MDLKTSVEYLGSLSGCHGMAAASAGVDGVLFLAGMLMVFSTTGIKVPVSRLILASALPWSEVTKTESFDSVQLSLPCRMRMVMVYFWSLYSSCEIRQ